MNKINVDKLRSDLIDYFGTAMESPFPMAIIDVSEIENALDDELIQIALDNHFDLNRYKV